MRFSLAVAAFAPILSAHAANILVQVGAGGKLAFSPSNITAAVGDVVSFQFQGKNHSVTQSTFANPCAIMTTPAQGIDSGFQAVPPNPTQLPEWSFTLNNASTPLWFFCAQTNPANHCNNGMVFSVNANENSPKSFAAFQALAMGGNAAAAGSAAGSSIGSGIAGATSAIGSAVSGATAAVGSAAGAAATDAANAISAGIAGVTGLGQNTGSAAPTASGNSTTKGNGSGRIGANAVSLFAVVGLAAGMLL